MEMEVSVIARETGGGLIEHTLDSRTPTSRLHPSFGSGASEPLPLPILYSEGVQLLSVTLLLDDEVAPRADAGAGASL